MMKRMLLVSCMGIFCFSSNLNAINPYHTLQKHAVAFGHSLDNVELPVVGKLTNLLPFALVAASFKECPGQAVLVLSGLCAYALWQNDSFRALLGKYGLVGQNNNQATLVTDDETLFVFEGDDADDAFEQAEIEDEMLEQDLLNDEEYDRNTNRKRAQKPASKFL